jgi:hypothetical protein
MASHDAVLLDSRQVTSATCLSTQPHFLLGLLVNAGEVGGLVQRYDLSETREASPPYLKSTLRGSTKRAPATNLKI